MAGEVQKPESVTMKQFPHYTQKNKETFLEHFVHASTIKDAAALTGITRRTVYNWDRDDPAFAAEFKRAKEDVADRLEAEAIRRACEGADRPVYYQGQKVDTYKEKSDTLLIFLLKGQKPEKYGDKVRQEITGQDGGPLQVSFSVDRPKRDQIAVPEPVQAQVVQGDARELPGVDDIGVIDIASEEI